MNGSWLQSARSRLLVLWAIVGLLVLATSSWATRAAAQEPPPEKPGPEEPSAKPGPEEPSAKPGPGEPSEPVSPYQQAFGEGVALYRAGKYEAAIKKFQKAYEIEPKASPLINIALSYKQLDQRQPPHPAAIPNTIEALKTAVSQHADSLDPRVKHAATAEIKALEAALRYLTVVVEPKEAAAAAEVFINGVLQPSDKLARIPLRARTWQVEAKCEGFQAAREEVTLISTREETVTLELEATTGMLEVRAAARTSRIEVESKEQKYTAQGQLQQRLGPGVYEVRVFEPGEEDGEPKALWVAVSPGQRTEVTQDEDGVLISDAAVSDPEEPDRQGLYGLGSGAILGLGGAMPAGYEQREAAPRGPALGLRLGYRVAHWVGFEGSVQYQVSYAELQQKKDTAIEADYTLQSLRFGGMMRFWYPGQNWVRFVGTAGGGLSYDVFDWEGPDATPDMSSKGVNFFVEVDVGAEFEFSNVLIDVVFQNVFQTTRSLEPEDADPPFDDDPIYGGGIAIAVGYGLW